MAKLTAKKAKLILKDGTIRGKKITERQRRFFGAIASGANTRAKRLKRKVKKSKHITKKRK